MLVMSKPNDLAFEVCEKKVKDFLDDRRSDAVDKALKRAEKHLNKLLIIVDVQNDFVSGSLGSKYAEKVIPNIVDKINSWDGDIIATRDTHKEDYLSTQEGKKLPIPHCIKGSKGHKLHSKIIKAIKDYTIRSVSFYHKNYIAIDKGTFGSTLLPDMIYINSGHKRDYYDYIEFVGFCTDICVISNALLVKSYFPEARIVVDAACCAGVTPELHRAALDVMKSCQIDIINDKTEVIDTK